jgi:hypothetical protein
MVVRSLTGAKEKVDGLEPSRLPIRSVRPEKSRLVKNVEQIHGGIAAVRRRRRINYGAAMLSV